MVYLIIFFITIKILQKYNFISYIQFTINTIFIQSIYLINKVQIQYKDININHHLINFHSNISSSFNIIFFSKFIYNNFFSFSISLLLIFVSIKPSSSTISLVNFANTFLDKFFSSK